MKRLLLILSIAAGLTITGCGSDDSGHSHGEDADHSHGQETKQHAPHNEMGGEAHQHEDADTTSTQSESEEEHSHSGESDHQH